MEITIDNQARNEPKCSFAISLLITVIFIGIIIGEYFVRDYLYTLSLSIIPDLQQAHPIIIKASNAFSFFGTAEGIIFFVLVTYNFGNTYKIFLLLFISLISCYVGGLLKLIYVSPRPFWSSPVISSLGCEGGWGNPSSHAIISVSLYLTLYHLFIEDSFQENSAKVKRIKGFSLTVIILFISCICFSRILLGVHAINQVIYGACIGFYIYFFFFHIVLINSNHSNQLLLFIQKSIGLSIFIIVLSLLPLIPYYLIATNSQLMNEWNNIINVKCPNFPVNKRFESDAFLCTWLLLVAIPCLMGMSFEYHCIYNSNVVKWSRINFNSQREEEANLLSGDSIETTCWNDTTFGKSIIRLIVLVAVFGVLMMPYYFISYDNNFKLVVCVKVLLPMMTIAFVMFSYLKQLCLRIHLANDTLFATKEHNQRV